MAEVKLTATTVPNGPFPISYSNDVKGGLKSVNTYEELILINPVYLIEGTLGYVKDTNTYYLYTDNTWNIHSVGSSDSESGQIHKFYNKTDWNLLTNLGLDYSSLSGDTLYFIYESDTDEWKFGDQFPIKFSN